MITTFFSSFLLIALAEMGDKSQLVCMLLASRHRGLPVVLGASAAFLILNAMAVVFGSAVAQAVPHTWLSLFAAALFAFFGFKSLLANDDEDDDIAEKSGHGIFLTTFMMIFMAELGDKTQLAVAALSTTQDAWGVYAGASLALIITSILGVVAGRWLTQHINVHWLHRISGVMFLLFAGWLVVDLLSA